MLTRILKRMVVSSLLVACTIGLSACQSAKKADRGALTGQIAKSKDVEAKKVFTRPSRNVKGQIRH